MLQFAKLKFLTFYLRADTSYSVHSPFVYKLASQIVDNKNNFAGRQKNENQNSKNKYYPLEYQLFIDKWLQNFDVVQYWIFSEMGIVFKSDRSEGSGMHVFFLDSSFLLLQAEFRSVWDRLQSTDRAVVCTTIRKSASSLEQWQQFCSEQQAGVLVDAWTWGCFRIKPGDRGLQKFSLVPSQIKPLSFRQFFPHVKQS